MPSEDRVARSLEKLRSQEKKIKTRKSAIFFKDISDMYFEDQLTDSKLKNQEQTISDPALAKKIDTLMRRMEEIVSKMSAGTNYLMYYGQMQELENQFIDITNDIEAQKDNIPPQLFNRILLKKQEIMKKKKK